jgi:hypothetical protein
VLPRKILCKDRCPQGNERWVKISPGSNKSVFQRKSFRSGSSTLWYLFRHPGTCRIGSLASNVHFLVEFDVSAQFVSRLYEYLVRKGLDRFADHAEVKLVLAVDTWFEKSVCRTCSRIFASRSSVGEIASLSFRNRIVRSNSLLSSFASTRGLPVVNEVSSAWYVADRTSMFPN